MNIQSTAAEHGRHQETSQALGPGTYNVQIRDAAHPGCVIVLNNALVITQPAILRATVTPTMVTCFGANDGIITITNPLGGYGTYEYSVNGGGSWQGKDFQRPRTRHL